MLTIASKIAELFLLYKELLRHDILRPLLRGQVIGLTCLCMLILVLGFLGWFIWSSGASTLWLALRTLFVLVIPIAEEEVENAEGRGDDEGVFRVAVMVQ